MPPFPQVSSRVSWSFGRCIMNLSTLISFHILLFLLFIHHVAADPMAVGTLEDDGDDDICKKVDCGEGKCVPSNTSFLGIKGFDCVCNPGWQKPQLPFTLPACTLPNCTINYECGNGAPPPPASLPPFGLTPCTFVWCGDGSCVLDGIGYYCNCIEGSANLFNLTGAACFKQCYLGGDCEGVQLGPPPLSGNTSSPPLSGTIRGLDCSGGFGQVTALLLFSLIVLLASI